MRVIILGMLFCGLFVNCYGQQFQTRTGYLKVKSSSKYMDIEADNYQVYSSIDFDTKEVTVTGLMKSFEFEMGALDRAFNSSHLDLSEYPKFNFKGILRNPNLIDLTTPGQYKTRVKGNLTIGEYKRSNPADAIFTVNEDGSISVVVDLSIELEDANLERINQVMKERLPSLIAIDVNKIGVSKNIEVYLNLTYK